MNCPEIKKLLIPFLESELSRRDRAMVVEHLSKCEDCKKEKALFETTWSMLDGIRAPEVSGNFTRNLMTRIYEQEAAKPKLIFALPKMDLRFAFRVLAPAMASLCVVVAVYYMLVQNNVPRKEPAANNVLPEPKERAVLQASGPASGQKARISAADEEIIRNLEAYENIELYQDYVLISDLDIVDNMGAKKAL